MHPNHKYASISDPVSLKERLCTRLYHELVGCTVTLVMSPQLVWIRWPFYIYTFCVISDTGIYCIQVCITSYWGTCWRQVHMKILPWQWVILPCTQYMILLCSWGMYWSSIAMATITWGNLRQNCQKDHWYSGLQRHWYNEWTWCHYMYM